MKLRTAFFAVLCVLLVAAGFVTGLSVAGREQKNSTTNYRTTQHTGFYNYQSLQDTKQPGILRVLQDGSSCAQSNSVATYTDWSGFVRASTADTRAFDTTAKAALDAVDMLIARPGTNLTTQAEMLQVIRKQIFTDDCSVFDISVVRADEGTVAMDGYTGRAFLVTRGSDKEIAIYVVLKGRGKVILLDRSLPDINNLFDAKYKINCPVAVGIEQKEKDQCAVADAGQNQSMLVRAFDDANLNSRAVALFSLFQPVLP